MTLSALICVSLEAAPVLADPCVGIAAVLPLVLKLLLVTMRVVTGTLTDEGEVAVGAEVAESVVLGAPPAGAVVATVLLPVGVWEGAPAPVPDVEEEVVVDEEGGPIVIL